MIDGALVIKLVVSAFVYVPSPSIPQTVFSKKVAGQKFHTGEIIQEEKHIRQALHKYGYPNEYIQKKSVSSNNKVSSIQYSSS